MRPRTLTFLVLFLAPLAAGCGPRLRAPQEFTPKTVRQIKYDDRCELQGYFDGAPPSLRRQSEVLISADERKGTVFGRVTFLLEAPAHQRAFARLLSAHYQRLPELDPARPMVAIVPFLRRGKANEHLPIDAEVEVEFGDDSFTLPYSPCLSAFFFGRDYYRMRRDNLTAR